MSVMVRVTAVPTSPEADTYTVECSECGPLSVETEEGTTRVCLEHLQAHGVDTRGYTI